MVIVCSYSFLSFSFHPLKSQTDFLTKEQSGTKGMTVPDTQSHSVPTTQTHTTFSVYGGSVY